MSVSTPRGFPSVAMILLLTGCTASGVAIKPDAAEAPAARRAESTASELADGWIEHLNDTGLAGLAQHALKSNFTLAQQAALVRQAEQQLRIDGSGRYPELDLSVDVARSRSDDDAIPPSTLSTQAGADLNLQWEVDLWGKLSATERQANLTLAARRADYAAARETLAADVAAARYTLIEAELLLQLNRDTLAILQQNLEIIEAGYRRGLNQALDVYLARNDVRTQAANAEERQRARNEAARALQLLLGEYPDGGLAPDSDLPTPTANPPPGIPGDLLRHRADLRSAWLELLAADAGLAIAHKQRFPSFTLTARAGDSAERVSDLLDGSLAWSLAAGITQPLFNAGRLRAAEAQARARVEELEQRYLANVYTAFAEVENALDQERLLQERYRHLLAAEENAGFAEELSFGQYRKGLTSYTTVLEAQRRSLEARSSVITLRGEILRNRIALYRALGGDPFPPESVSSDPPAGNGI
ncbi:MAG: efflux transporter outer membrane subunit [Gammaproteobacteria bacterium]|nr:efflux transporter outer membrane subunit [Gammaproteobacteria bacterium]